MDAELKKHVLNLLRVPDIPPGFLALWQRFKLYMDRLGGGRIRADQIAMLCTMYSTLVDLKTNEDGQVTFDEKKDGGLESVRPANKNRDAYEQLKDLPEGTRVKQGRRTGTLNRCVDEDGTFYADVLLDEEGDSRFIRCDLVDLDQVPEKAKT